MTPKQGTMEELWEAILHYLKRCNRDGAGRKAHELVVSVQSSGDVKYIVMEGDEVLAEDSDLEKIARWLKVYVSWD